MQVELTPSEIRKVVCINLENTQGILSRAIPRNTDLLDYKEVLEHIENVEKYLQRIVFVIKEAQREEEDAD